VRDEEIGAEQHVVVAKFDVRDLEADIVELLVADLDGLERGGPDAGGGAAEAARQAGLLDAWVAGLDPRSRGGLAGQHRPFGAGIEYRAQFLAVDEDRADRVIARRAKRHDLDHRIGAVRAGPVSEVRLAAVARAEQPDRAVR
jgi:hypothetical protein